MKRHLSRSNSPVHAWVRLGLTLGLFVALAACEGLPVEEEGPTPCDAVAACADLEAPLDCTGGWACLEGGCAYQCDIGSPCSDDSQCGQDMVCGEEGCVAPPVELQCTSDADCGEGGFCHDGQCGVDPPPPGCTGDADCDEGQVCHEGECLYVGAPVCESDADCPDDQVCHEGDCVFKEVPPECVHDEDCGEGEICHAGQCTKKEPPPECVHDEDCPEGHVCHEGQCTKKDVPPACVHDEDCAKGEVCHEGECVEKEKPPSECVITGCSGELCAHSPTQSTCEAKDWYVCLEYSKCGNFGVDDKCSWTETEAFVACMQQFIDPPEGCKSDGDCAMGEKCIEGDCVKKEEPTECIISGCSGEICAAEPMGSSCEWKPEYECLQFTKCGYFGPEDTCGWKMTDAYWLCLKELEGCKVDGDCGENGECIEGECYDKPPPSECIVTGCSGEICHAGEVASPCIEKDWYVCLEYTECGSFGPEGACGWAETDAYVLCLEEFKDPGGCKWDEQCPEGTWCKEGECVEKPAPEECIISGCSGEICAPEPMNSICLWQPWYECLAYSECGPYGPDGTCGWHESELFLWCIEELENPPDDKPNCTSAADCDGDLVCNAADVCASNPGCDPGGVCTDECWGWCVEGDEPPPKTCTSDLDCDEGWSCECVDAGWGNGIPIMCNMECVESDPPPDKECYSDEDCPEGEECSWDSNGFAPDGDMAPGTCVDKEPAPAECMATGCSGTVCSSEPEITTCEWKPQYACYEYADCGFFGPEGTCGWHETEKFVDCMADFP